MNYNVEYIPDYFEKSISDSLIYAGIHTPNQLSIEALSKVYHVDILNSDTVSFGYHNEQEKLRLIALEKAELLQKRERFFILLSHLLLHHTGEHYTISNALFSAQRKEAIELASYIAIPYHMLSGINIKQNESIQEILMKKFMLPPALVEERTKQIQNRIEKQIRANDIVFEKVRRLAIS